MGLHYAVAWNHWLEVGFPRDFKTLNFLGRNVMVIYACAVDMPDMQLMAGITFLAIGLFGKTLGSPWHGKDGERWAWLLFGIILVADGLTAAPPPTPTADG